MTSARVLLGFLAASFLSTAAAEVIDPAFRQTDVLTLPANPQVTSMAWAPDGSDRLFLTGKDGYLWIVKDGALLAEPAYQFFPRFQNGELVTTSEAGLAGIAFDPAFADNHYIYLFAVLYVPATSNTIEQQIIRFTMQGDTATERTTLISGLPSSGGIHNGGALAFGPDGLLYFGVGNNGTALGEGDDLESPACKISRASTVVGAPPPPGPFNDGAGPNYDYTFARGARNPFTMAFHPVTGSPWVNIVGDGFEQIFAVSEGAHLGYPMENVEPGTGDATASPIVVYHTSPAVDLAVGGASRANNTVTITTRSPHQLRKGNTVTISNIDDPSFDGEVSIASIPSATTFTYAQAGPDAISENGTATGATYGRAILGGTFYDATLFPAAYRQNFFFGDHASQQLVRVETSADVTISRVSRFGTQMGKHIDASTGPDGALWLVDHAGTLRRITYAATEQGIVVSPQNLRLTETSRGFVGVRLAMAPPTDVTVTLARTSGSSFVSVPAAPLVFTTANWEQPQYVEVTSRIDGDTIEDIATFEATATGIAADVVTVRVTDTRDADPSAIDAPPEPNSAGGCCGVVGSARGSFVLALVVLGILRRRRA
jgi:glucose/arabinose dehydrogenase